MEKSHLILITILIFFMNNILIIGCGHMGSALLDLWIKNKLYKFTVVDPLKYKIIKGKYKNIKYPKSPNLETNTPGINSSPNGPVKRPYQFDLNPSKSYPKPSFEE